jgi:hypothetical protein
MMIMVMIKRALSLVVTMNRITGITHRRLLLLPLLILALAVCSMEVEIDVEGTVKDSETPPEQPPQHHQQQPVYGVDVSWPIHHHLDIVSEDETTNTINNPIRSDLAYIYGKYMTGCYERYDWAICERHEEERLALNLNQPPLMKNFTAAGYAKVKAPAKAFAILSDYFHKYKAATAHDNDEAVEGSSSSSSSLFIPEQWPKGNVYTNHWETSTEMNHLDMHMPIVDKERISNLVQGVLEQWCGVPLIETSLYGIRVYRKGSILAPHVDRLPLVISAIINVAQGSSNGDESWPLEVIGHDGIAVNITMVCFPKLIFLCGHCRWFLTTPFLTNIVVVVASHCHGVDDAVLTPSSLFARVQQKEPGDMILYESHSVIHGRPFPLQAE